MVFAILLWNSEALHKPKTMRSKAIDFQEVLGIAALDKRLEVLRTLHRSGSISEAARATGVSYKAAWQALETLSNLAGAPLVAKAVGGAGGGGAKLTHEGVQVLAAADRLHGARQQALAELQREASASGLNWQGLASVGLRTSMRNQLPCTVSAIERSQGMGQVWLSLPDGQTLVSRITLESVELLGLTPGLQVLALFKATAVTVAPTIVAMGEVNVLQGKVQRKGAGAAGVEVSVQLAPGLSVVGFANSSAPVKLRQAVMVAIEQTALVIGLAA